jgi:hypothetical protein
MKHLILTLLAVLSLSTAHAENIKGDENAVIRAGFVEGVSQLPRTGELTGSVISLYYGSAFALEQYAVTVGNTAAPCEGDDCIQERTFMLVGGFKGVAKKVSAIRIDKNTYTVKVLTTVVKGQRDNGSLIIKNARIDLTVRFNATGVEETASVRTVLLN